MSPIPYTEPAYDDTRCSCGAPLADNPAPYSWQDHGYCDIGCAVRDRGGFYLFGTSALEMVSRPGRLGGPGFEADIVRAWRKAARPNAPLMLSRLSGEADLGAGYARSWVWRLRSGGICHVMRLTAKEAEA